MNSVTKKTVVLACAAFSAFAALAFNKSMYPYTLPAGKKGAALGCVEAKTGMALEPGKWYTNFQVCKQYADDHGIPMVAIWSNEGCSHCWYTDLCFIQQDFIDWKNTHDAGKVIYCFMAGGYGNLDQVKSTAYNWMWYGGGAKLNAYPFVVLWWKKGNVNERYTGDNFCGSNIASESTIPGRVKTITGRMEKAFAKWSPAPSYAGGTFADPDTAGNRLEFEDGTEKVTVNLKRDAGASVATNVTLVAFGPAGAKVLEKKVVWAKDQTNATAEVTFGAGTCTADGQKVTLYLQDGGKYHATNHVTYVKRAASAANPLWLGEKFDFGEWTCDVDAAKAKAKAASGSAYTLVSIQGSMWCPDCANTDRNFLEVTDGTGANRFCAWAKSKKVALVSMDVPNYNASGPTPETAATPTLLSKKCFATALARAKEFPQAGAEAALTNKIDRSGLGYLTRKGATDEQAAAQMKKFHDLAATNTDKGGFHRPEDGNPYRTGVPIFVLLRKDGSVAARFTRFASASPMAADKAKFADYLKRFEEMLAIADNDAAEIENNHPGDGATEFAANGGTAKGELSHADVRDAFKLTGVGGNADQKVTVKGETEATVTAQFWKKNADGSFAAIGQEATNTLARGVALTQTFAESGDYYLLVKGADGDAAFAADNAKANNFHQFTVSGATVLVPHDDQVAARAPADSEFVTIRLEKDAVYCFAGVKTNDNAAAFVEVGAMGAYSLLKATGTGDFEVKISTGKGGEINYQLWKPGQIAFTQTARSVPESVNDLNDDWVEFQVARVGGKSGKVKGRVTIDNAKTTFAAARYSFETNAPNAFDFVWADGEASNVTVRVKIIDDMLYDGDGDVVFNLEVLACDADDVTVEEGKGTFTLTVLEDDEAAPGRGVITRTTPDCAKKGTVYVRESDGAKIWAERIEAFDGLVAAELTSSLAGVTYATENPRDLTNDLDRTLLYWSSREKSEKYVLVKGIAAGKSARIQLKSYGVFKTVAGSNSVTVVAVADDAPAFAKDESNFALNRYVAGDQATVALDPETLKGGKVSFTKLSGTLPAGVKATFDESAKALVFAGVTTAKPGTYEVAYQVVETRSGKRVPGLTTKVTFTVSDPTDVKTNPEGANPSIAKTRTFKSIAVVNPVEKRMAGVLQLTLPARGNASGKYLCESGTISLSAKNWSEFDPATKEIRVELASRKTGHQVGVTVNADGSLDMAVNDPAYPDAQFDAEVSGEQWAKDNAASDWQGYYTVALPVTNVVEESTANVASVGSGYLTFNFTSKSAWNSGTVRWAGMLPNGTTVSGSSTLGAPYKGMSAAGDMTDWAKLPIFSRSSMDVASVYARILRNAKEKKAEDRRAVLSAEEAVSWWEHAERKSDMADFFVDFGVYGAVYDKTEDLGGCCQEYYSTQDMVLGFGVGALGSTYYGVPATIAPLAVSVESNAIVMETQDNPAKVKLSLSRSTGVVSGSFSLACEDKTLSAKYKGVILTGWGEGCGCGPTAGLKIMPFVNGSFYFSDKVEYAPGKTMTVKRGGMATVDVNVVE